jgi:hypothetical protein
MTRKTESLSFPKDPLAAMRELQELDTSPRNDTPPAPAEERDNATSLPDTHATGSEVSSVTTPAASSRGGSEATKEKRPRAQQAPAATERDPIAGAVKELLSRPYSSEEGKAPLTVSTVKMPSEVWERLGWAAKLTGQAKQDIIRDALKDYFRKLLKEL